MATPRNNIAKQDHSVRMTICRMRLNGKSYVEIRAYLNNILGLKVKFHNSSFQTYFKSREYLDFVAAETSKYH
jgi:hypothetical protein